jgi:hypothetical protein
MMVGISFISYGDRLCFFTLLYFSFSLGGIARQVVSWKLQETNDVEVKRM